MRGRQRSATVWPRAFVTSSSTSHQARTRRSGPGVYVSKVRCHTSCGLLTTRRSLCCSPTGDAELERWSIPTSSEAQANHPVVEPAGLRRHAGLSTRLVETSSLHRAIGNTAVLPKRGDSSQGPQSHPPAPATYAAPQQLDVGRRRGRRHSVITRRRRGAGTVPFWPAATGRSPNLPNQGDPPHECSLGQSLWRRAVGA